MKTLMILVAAVVCLAAPTSCFALWSVAVVDQEAAKRLGIEVRATPAGPNQLRVELEFQDEELLKDFDRVELRVGGGDNPPVTAPLKEKRPQPDRVVVSFAADRKQLESVSLRIMVPGSRGGTIYVVHVKDFVELKKDEP